MTWPTVQLGDVATVNWGDTSTTKAAYTQCGYPAFSASGPDGLLPYADHSEQGVVLSAIGAQCGKTWLTPDKWSCIKNTIWFRARGGHAFTPYLYYATSDPSVWPRRGAAQPFVGLGDARALKIPLPPLATQRKVAAFLAAYDDLIESNNRRITVLEEIADRIYREWFVHFHYPGHEAVPLVDSELGLIPEGWERQPLGRVSDLRWGDTAKTKAAYSELGYDAYSAAGLDGKMPHFDFDRDGVVVSAIGANCGRTWLAKGKWSCIKNTIRLWSISSRASTEYLYLATASEHFWPKRGAAQPFISQADARAARILLPTEGLAKAFERLAAPLFDEAELVRLSNRSLRDTRDLLVPRVVSREIDVAGLNIVMPDVYG